MAQRRAWRNFVYPRALGARVRKNMWVRVPPPALPVFARDACRRSDLGCAVGPGVCLLELTRDAEQDVFATVGGDELYADRQALGCPLQWEADRRLAAGV